MIQAINLSHKASSVETAFNVGAVLISNSGQILSTGFSRELPGNTHAEECCLKKLPDISLAQDATIYSSMEPCGERASGNRCCASLLIQSGVKRVVMGVKEPAKFIKNTKGIQMLLNAGIKVDYIEGLEEQCLEANRHVL